MLNDAVKNSNLVIWRDIMAKRPVQIPTGIMTALTEAYEQEMLSSHNLIYSSSTSKVFLPVGK